VGESQVCRKAKVKLNLELKPDRFYHRGLIRVNIRFVAAPYSQRLAVFPPVYQGKRGVGSNG
jgi:hypothetical protein